MGSINVRSDLAENFERKNVPGFRLAALIPKKFIREIRLLHRRQSFLASTRSWTTGESRIHGKNGRIFHPDAHLDYTVVSVRRRR